MWYSALGRKVSIFVLGLLLVTPSASAQTATPQASDTTVSDADIQSLSDYFTERSQCLDKYKYGSVRFEVENSAQQTVQAGQALVVKGTVENTNDFPLPEGRIYVHVLRQDTATAAENWHPLVFEGDIAGDFSLAANEEKPFTFSWQSPTGAPSGVYRAEFFYLAGTRFVMAGLPYTPAVSGGSTLFAVSGNPTSQYVEFDRGSVTLQGNPLPLRSVPPSLPSTGPVTASVALQNTGSAPKTATVTTSLYRWAITDKQPPLTTNSTQVSIPANGSVDVPFTWPTPESGAYELVFEATTGTTGELPTRLKFRFPVDGNVPRIMFTGITGVSGDNVEVTTCAVNASFGEGGGSGNVTASVLLPSGESVGSSQTASDAVDLSSSVFTIPASALVDGIQVSAEATDSTGNVVDSHSLAYGDSLLQNYLPTDNAIATPVQESLISPTMVWVAIGIVAIIFVAAMIYMWMSRRKKNTQLPPSQPLNPPSTPL